MRVRIPATGWARGVGLLGWAALAGASLAAAPLAAQADDSALKGRVPAEVLAAVEPVLAQAGLDSLPVATLESKVLEGVAKGVPADRIGAAVSALAREFGVTRAALRQALPAAPLADGEVASAALAVRQGLTVADMAPLWAGRPAGASLEIPLAVTGELARRGIGPEQAVGLMRHVLESGTSMERAAQLPARVDLALPNAENPGAAVVQALRSLGIPDPPRGPPGGVPGRPGAGPPGGGPPGGGPPGGGKPGGGS